uniref:Glutathione peroxidase n=1 Tax=Panagrolaimus superbus TaxID=310955 RepID=A0A914XRR2_9BILA
MLSFGSRILSPITASTVSRFSSTMSSSLYNFVVKDADGKDVSLEKYKGKVLIIVNVASQCGFTDSNYTQFKELLDKYRNQGLEIAAFPCNQFKSQEPGCEIDIKNFVSQKFNFEPDLYSKIKVNGDDAAPLYKFLKKEQGGTLIDAIKWNFTKFLVDRNGNVVKRFAPTTEPKDMVKDIEQYL